MSPVMSMTRVSSETSRTSNVVAASGMVVLLGAADGARFVVGDGHEVGQPRDLEDLAVVVGQSECLHFDPVGTGLGQESDDQRYPRAVDVGGALEVEDDRGDAVAGRIAVGPAQDRVRGPGHVTVEVDQRDSVAFAHSGAKLTRGHLRLLAGVVQARWSALLARWSHVLRPPCSGSGTAPSH